MRVDTGTALVCIYVWKEHKGRDPLNWQLDARIVPIYPDPASPKNPRMKLVGYKSKTTWIHLELKFFELENLLHESLKFRVSLADIVRCGQGRDFVRCLTSYTAFHEYEMRECEAAGDAADDTLALDLFNDVIINDNDSDNNNNNEVRNSNNDWENCKSKHMRQYNFIFFVD